CRDLGAIRVADDHVEPAPTRPVRVRLVASIDDGAAQGGLEAHLGLDVVRALRQLEARALARGTDPHSPRARKDGSRHEMSGDASCELLEIDRPGYQEVFVGSVARALAVHVVLVE